MASTSSISETKTQTVTDKQKIGFQRYAPKLPPPQTGAGSRTDVTSNLRQIDFQHDSPVFKYDVTIVLKFPKRNGAPDEEFSIDITRGGVSNEKLVRRMEQCAEAFKSIVALPRYATTFGSKADKEKLSYDRRKAMFSFKDIDTDDKGKGKLILVFRPEDRPNGHLTNISKDTTMLRVEMTLKKVPFVHGSEPRTGNVALTVSEVANNADTTLLEAVSSMISSNINRAPENVVTVGTGVHVLHNENRFANVGTIFPNRMSGFTSTLPGLVKSVQTLEGVNKKNKVFLVADVRKSNYHDKYTHLNEEMHPNARLVSKLANYFPIRQGPNRFQWSNTMTANSREANSLFPRVKGLHVHPIFGKGGFNERGHDARVYTIKGFGPAAESRAEADKFECKDENGATSSVSVELYFRRKYNHRVMHPKLFTIVVRGDNNDDIRFPVDTLVVATPQRVSKEQMTLEEETTLIRESTCHPTQRFRRMGVLSNEIGLNNAIPSNTFSIDNNYQKITARVLPTEKVEYQKDSVATVSFGKWSGQVQSRDRNQSVSHKLIKGVRISSWDVYFVTNAAGGHGTRESFASELIKAAKPFGMDLGKPGYHAVHINDIGSMKKCFEQAKKNDSTFMIFLGCDRNREIPNFDFHANMKFCEQEFGIITQHVLMANTDLVKKAGDTARNILLKVNAKNGGLNHRVHLPRLATTGNWLSPSTTNTRNTTMILSLDIPTFSKPKVTKDDTKSLKDDTTSPKGYTKSPKAKTATAQPHRSEFVTVGYSANMSDDVQKFVGGYCYASKNDEVFGQVIDRILDKCFESMTKSGRGTPRRLIVYINGVGEGNFALVNEVYASRIRTKVAAKSSNIPAEHLTIVIIMASKRNHERFYVESQKSRHDPVEQNNVQAGTVVDHTLVSPVLSQFFLAPHKGNMGTTQFSKFTMITNNGPDRIKTLEEVEKNTNQLCYLHQIVNSIISLPAPIRIASEFSKRGTNNLKVRLTQGGPLSVDVLNKELTYDEKRIEFYRFNA